jgi:hypothetical protein|tara:strand:- start:234 stop:467 length:234 start_codon:yes stop_codon:yes gene_type:complete
MQQIYVLLSVLVLMLGFGALMHETQYKNARVGADTPLTSAESLDALDPAAGISYNSEMETYQQALNKLDDKRIYLNK